MASSAVCKALVARFVADRSAVAAPLFAIMLPGLMGIAGFSIDYSMMQAADNRLQVAADAAALAAAPRVASSAQAISRAQEMATANAGNGTLSTTDIVTGRWNQGQGEFTAGASNPNAVQVTTRYAQANGNPHQLIFGGLIGIDTVDLSATAIAMSQGPACTSNIELVPDPFIPTRSSISTLGGPCAGSCPAGFRGPNGFLQTPEGNPIVRLDVSASDFAISPNRTLTVRAGSAVNETYRLPGPGRWFVIVRSYTNPYNINDPATQNLPKTNIVYAAWGGGTATWSNNIRGTQTFTTPAQCPPGNNGNGNGNGNNGGGNRARLVS
jgi:Flp pilus assembly protein TadG